MQDIKLGTGIQSDLSQGTSLDRGGIWAEPRMTKRSQPCLDVEEVYFQEEVETASAKALR